MSNNTPNNIPADSVSASAPWYKDLTRYHWFVFVVCCLGWGLDCFDQQIFNIMRNPALADLLGVDATHASVGFYGGLATSIMLLGWGFGGILFGVMADKYGRARTMILTIFVYAVFTGLCGLAVSWWDFFLYRFFCGMGVGGQFAAGVTLLAETMPDKARPKALGWLQIVAAFCNLCAASLAMLCGFLEGLGYFGDFSVWRFLFLVGFAPALLAFAVMRHLEEPKAWKDAIAAGGVKKAGSIPDLFRHPRWRYNVIIGMCLATCGVIGLWGIGFFSVDLTRTTLRLAKNQEVRERGEVETTDFEFIRMLANNPQEFLPIALDKKLMPQSFIGSAPGTNDAGAIYLILTQIKEKADSLNVDVKCPECGEVFIPNLLDGLNTATILAVFDEQTENELQKIWWQSAKERLEEKRSQERKRLEALLDQELQQTDKETFEELATQIAARARAISGHANLWGGFTSMLFNFGALFGTWVIVVVAQAWGRRIAFTLFFGASFFMTIFVFMKMGSGTIFINNPHAEILVMAPVLGFCILSIFGGYAVYFPELFPTRLRSTAVSFCYNIARFISALGPAALGILTAYVFQNTDEPIRWAGAAMSITFIFGIVFAWLGPETKGQPLPEE